MLHTAQSVNYQANPLDINAVENANLPLAQLVAQNNEITEIANKVDMSEELFVHLCDMGRNLERTIATAPVHSMSEAKLKLEVLKQDIISSSAPPIEHQSYEWQQIELLTSVIAFINSQSN